MVNTHDLLTTAAVFCGSAFIVLLLLMGVAVIAALIAINDLDTSDGTEDNS